MLIILGVGKVLFFTILDTAKKALKEFTQDKELNQLK